MSSTSEIITNDELLALKEKIQRTKQSLKDHKDEVREERRGYKTKIQELSKLCGSECLRELEKHLEICDGGYDKDHENYRKPYHKCEMRTVCYECKKSHNIKNNGRCSHFYDIEYLNEQLENTEYYDDCLEDEICELEADYDRKLAIKEGRYEQYKEDLYDYFS